jgi:hypothetical protein
MSMLYRWGVEELDKLQIPEEKWRLDLLLENSQTPAGCSNLRLLTHVGAKIFGVP